MDRDIVIPCTLMMDYIFPREVYSRINCESDDKDTEIGEGRYEYPLRNTLADRSEYDECESCEDNPIDDDRSFGSKK
jgi:hypothetical protein